jgi:hypothetical protein
VTLGTGTRQRALARASRSCAVGSWGLLGRPASEYGRLCHRSGSHEGGARCRRALKSPALIARLTSPHAKAQPCATVRTVRPWWGGCDALGSCPVALRCPRHPCWEPPGSSVPAAFLASLLLTSAGLARALPAANAQRTPGMARIGLRRSESRPFDHLKRTFDTFRAGLADGKSDRWPCPAAPLAGVGRSRRAFIHSSGRKQ